MNHANALVLTEKTCHIACINCIYNNPPVELTTRNCIIAGCATPCALCCARSGKSLMFEPSSVPTLFPSKHLSLTATLKKKKRSVLDMKKKEHVQPFTESQGPALYDLILSQLLIIQGKRYRLRVKAQKQQQANAKRKEREENDDDEWEEEEISDSELLPSPTAPKQPALEPLNTANTLMRPKPKLRAKPAPQPSSKQVLDSYRPECPNFRWTNDENEGDEADGRRRSSCLRR
ncbi:hypothetical protein BT96DRAFT_1007796 [Gymnopus androsaceus JB14]|uniref:Uncharacterized protein n=1 Tax=Gymnopus androsaceus JB14 TaxID=1447944 RepID=A0A6A4GH34_9AGAR|nr:hypothetical protein BT96DRAFT_1007796 [Gymnopus androsaceus JB14]